MVFIDSNIWFYYFNSSAREHEETAEKVDEILDSNQSVHINSVILMEVGHFLIKNLGGIKGKKKLDQMLQYSFKTTDIGYSLARNSLDILAEEHQTGIGGRDATIIASMRKQGVEKLVTHDQSFKKINGIKVIDPVEEG